MEGGLFYVLAEYLVRRIGIRAIVGEKLYIEVICLGDNCVGIFFKPNFL